MSTPTKPRELYVNLPVADLPRAKAFFAELGFAFNPRFTNDVAAGMNLSDTAAVMLLERHFFETFTPRRICDTSKSMQALVAFGVESRADVDALVERALALGATEAREPSEYGDYMYGRSFFDLDGHQWEAIWTDDDKFPGADA